MDYYTRSIGIVYLNPTIFGHLHEAYDILNIPMVMEDLMVSRGGTLFARLVALRIKMSAFLSGLNYNLDRNYQRLLQQQTLCVRALKKKVGGGQRTTLDSMMVNPSDYRRAERRHQNFNYLTGSYNNTF